MPDPRAPSVPAAAEPDERRAPGHAPPDPPADVASGPMAASPTAVETPFGAAPLPVPLSPPVPPPPPAPPAAAPAAPIEPPAAPEDHTVFVAAPLFDPQPPPGVEAFVPPPVLPLPPPPVRTQLPIGYPSPPVAAFGAIGPPPVAQGPAGVGGPLPGMGGFTGEPPEMYPPMEAPGGPPPAGAPPYGWPLVVARDPTARYRGIGTSAIVLGLAIVVWGVGIAFVAAAAFQQFNGSPHLYRIGLVVQAVGLILAGLVTIVLGAVYRRT